MEALDLTTNLEHLALWCCAGFAVLIFALMLFSVATFRHTPEPGGRAPRAEVLWAIVPILIVIAAAAPALKVLMPATAAPNVADAKPLAHAGTTEGEIPQKAFNEDGVPL
jgi:heme/copper-type cytochrome/quinol oxidase subunit 2